MEFAGTKEAMLAGSDVSAIPDEFVPAPGVPGSSNPPPGGKRPTVPSACSSFRPQ
jgi:hypothetical protein